MSSAQILDLPDTKEAAPGFRNARRGYIQGLRALAVVAVIFYHLRVPGFSGGFVGVDAFFVISGFLVTGMLFREIDSTGRILILPFLARRSRRLLPNAALTLFAVLLATMLFLPRYRLDAVVDDLVSAALFYSNVHFAALTVDYFALDMPPSPALHFWSLSIEGQFYLLLSIFLFLVCRLLAADRRTAAAALALVLVMSFAASLAIADSDQTKAFFSIWARCWQFALGGLITVARLPAGHKIGAAASALGIAGLITCIIVLDDTLAYPGLYALLPTFSAALVIWGGDGGGPVARLLSQPAMQAAGDRSYSLYLWHWPVILIAGEHLSRDHRWALLPLTLIFAEIAYRCVETPLRYSRGAAPKAVYVIAAGAAAQCLVALAGLGVLQLPLMAHRSDTRIAGLITSAAADKGRNYDLGCHLTDGAADIPANCAFGDVNGAKTVVLFGDSHAAQWFEPLEAAASMDGWKLLAWTKSSCPSADVSIYFIPKKAEFPECDLWRQRVMSRLLADKPALVVLSNNNAYSGWISDRRTGARLHKSNALEALRQGLRSTVFQLAEAGVNITVIADTPRAFSDYRDCISRNGGAACERRREEAVAEPQLELEALAGLQGVTIENFNGEICGPHLCPLFSGGKLIYRDTDHLAATYAKNLEPRFAEALRRVE